MSTTLVPRAQRRSTIALATLVTVAGSAVAPVPALADTVPGACYSGTPGTVGTVPHPSEAEDIVLRMSVGGGFVPVEVAFIEQNPVFTLYGNDAAIFQPPSTQQSLSDPWSPFQCIRLTPAQVDELLTFALDDAGLATAEGTYPHPNIVDVPTTTFTIDAGGVDKVVNVQALGFEQAPDPEARAGFEALADLLSDFGAEVEGEEPYDVLAYGLLLTPWWAESDAEPVAWPWPDLDLEDFNGSADTLYGTLTAEQAAALVAVPNGGQMLVPVTTPDGAVMSAAVRPILPEAEGVPGA